MRSLLSLPRIAFTVRLIVVPRSLAGYPLSGGVLAETASATHVLLSRRNVSISATTKLIDLDGVRGASAGDIIEYEIELNNTGTTTLTNIDVSDHTLDEQSET